MNEDIKSNLQRFVKLVSDKFKPKQEGLTFSALCTVDYINYLISKGSLYEIDKEQTCDYVLKLLFVEFNIKNDEFKNNELLSDMIQSIRDFNIKLMMHRLNYDYETLSFFLKQLN